MRNYILILAFFGIAPNVNAISKAKNWEKIAVSSLTYEGKKLTLSESGGFSETNKKPLCIRLNNYGCVKQGIDPWKGSIGKDKKNHAVFEDPSYSIRAIVRDYCSKHKRGLRTAVELANAYSPWCDTLGSLPTYRGWGRSCNDLPRRPSSFRGPLCKKPKGKPTVDQCQSCNCPNHLAELWLKGMKRDGASPSPYSDLKLFNSTGKPDSVTFSILLKNKIRIETNGFEPTEALIKKGIDLAGTCR